MDRSSTIWPDASVWQAAIAAKISMHDIVEQSNPAAAPADTAPRVLAVVTDYTSMLMAFRARAAERQIVISGEEVAEVSGLGVRRLTQMLSLQTLRNVRNVRRMGILSLGPLLGVLGIKMLVVEDPEALAKYGSRIPARAENHSHSTAVQVIFSRRWLSKIGKIGGKNSRANMSKSQARKLARKGAIARAESLSPQQRSDIARRAVQARSRKRAMKAA
jgi:hypothetical protein